MVSQPNRDRGAREEPGLPQASATPLTVTARGDAEPGPFAGGQPLADPGQAASLVSGLHYLPGTGHRSSLEVIATRSQ